MKPADSIALQLPIILWLASAAPALADSHSFAPIDVPGAVWTGPFGITAAGDVVGYFQSGTDNRFRGFIWRRGDAAPAEVFEVPDSRITYAIGMNAAREVVGWTQDQNNAWHGFRRSGGNYTLIDFPDPKTFYTVADGINDSGDIVGA
jgi:hypothetical protein